MHTKQREFCESVRARFPQWFKGKRVLDCGSLDINGNNRYLFTDCEYTGIDLGPGKNVDVVCPIYEFKDSKGFDVVISTECFEHDKRYAASMLNIVTKLLRPSGLFLFTCATTGRKEHGTDKSEPADSPFTNNYYRNVCISDVVFLERGFKDYAFEVESSHHDLYFWGMR